MTSRTARNVLVLVSAGYAAQMALGAFAGYSVLKLAWDHSSVAGNMEAP